MNQWLKIYNELYFDGKLSEPRGLKIKEIEDYLFIGDPYDRFANFKERKLSLKYIIGEFCWYLRGNLNDLNGITHYSKFWSKLKNKSKPYLNSNYGHYIFQQGQYDYCLEQLKNDKDTRQAAIIIAKPDVMMSDSKDKICTYSMSFRIREDKLNVSVNMRSNDYVLGLQIDYFQFTVIQEMMLKELQEAYPELQMGYYCHKADSLHIYERNFEMMESIINSEGKSFNKIEFPKIKNTEEVNVIRTLLPKVEHAIRENQTASVAGIIQMINIQGFEFTKACIEYLEERYHE